jgi:preprotein translocase subunit SecG
MGRKTSWPIHVAEEKAAVNWLFAFERENRPRDSCSSAPRSPYFRAIGPVSYAGSGARKVCTLLDGLVAVLHLLVSLSLIFLILLHAGRGGGMSDMFGGGMSSGSVGGSTVVEKNLDRLTVVLAVGFTITTFWLTWLLAS